MQTNLPSLPVQGSYRALGTFLACRKWRVPVELWSPLFIPSYSRAAVLSERQASPAFQGSCPHGAPSQRAATHLHVTVVGWDSQTWHGTKDVMRTCLCSSKILSKPCWKKCLL